MRLVARRRQTDLQCKLASFCIHFCLLCNRLLTHHRSRIWSPSSPVFLIIDTRIGYQICNYARLTDDDDGDDGDDNDGDVNDGDDDGKEKLSLSVGHPHYRPLTTRVSRR